MSSLSPDRLDRAMDLVIARATVGLSPAEGEELRELLLGVPASEVVEMERAIDATRAALGSDDEEAMPGELTRRIADAAPLSSGVLARLPAIEPGRERRSTVIPWLAAAACLMLAGATLLWTRPWAGIGGPERGSVAAEVDKAPDVVRWAFKANVDEYKGAGGEVVWSDRLQKGYMRLKGIAANDPRVKQFQLWIVDPTRDQKPVDGGVFDVASSGEVIVPFESRLSVRGPAAFAITAEKPGGVVVSGGPLLLVAAKPG